MVVPETPALDPKARWERPFIVLAAKSREPNVVICKAYLTPCEESLTLLPSVLIVLAMANETAITRKQAAEALGGVPALAKALGISRSAVYQWPEDDPIPELQALRLRYELLPSVFGDSPKPKREAA